MAAKSYKQLYEESKVTEDELFALEAVAYGCNTNKKLQTINGSAKFLDRKTDKTVSFEGNVER